MIKSLGRSYRSSIFYKMANMRKHSLFCIMVIIAVLFSVNSFGALLFEDDFNDNSVNNNTWTETEPEEANDYEYGEVNGTYYGYASMTFHDVADAESSGLLLSDYSILPDLEGYVEFNVRYVTADVTMENNDAFSIGISNLGGEAEVGEYTLNGYTGSVDDCGMWLDISYIASAGQYNKFVASTDGTKEQNLESIDNDWHKVKIVVDRLASSTKYSFYWDTQFIKSVSQSGDCANPNLYFFFFTRMQNSTEGYEAQIDNVYVDMSGAGNETGDTCNEDADCEVGVCQYGICRPGGRGEYCDESEDCISGICSNNVCTAGTLFQNLNAMKNEQVGEDSQSANLIALFFMIGVPVAVIFAGRSMFAVAGGMVLYFGLAFFFTFIGWLSPFILVGSIFMGLILLVMGFVIGMGG